MKVKKFLKVFEVISLCGVVLGFLGIFGTVGSLEIEKITEAEATHRSLVWFVITVINTGIVGAIRMFRKEEEND